MFRVPEGESTSPPSTPPRSSSKNHPLPYSSNPSTTPAHPPPTSLTAASTTPAGPPPSSLFGSSDNRPIPFPSKVPPAEHDRPEDESMLDAEYADQDGPVDFDDFMDQDMHLDYDYDHDGSQGPLDFVKSNGQGSPMVKNFDTLEIAKSFAPSSTSLHESDDFVLRTAENVDKVSHASPAQKLTLLPAAVRDLIHLWLRDQDPQAYLQPGFGPGSKASPTCKAGYLSSLLFTLHHPSRRPVDIPGRLRRQEADEAKKPIPEALLDWLKSYHGSSMQEYHGVLNHRPNCASHDRFWDVIFIAAVRGELKVVIQLLREADFSKAATALEEGASILGYHGKQLDVVRRCIGQAVEVLQSCPAISAGDWRVQGRDWTIFRKRVANEMSNVDALARAPDVGHQNGSRGLRSPNFGYLDDEDQQMRQPDRAESKIPWIIHQNLGYLYGQLMGTESEILAACSDWLEGTIATAVWWNSDSAQPSKQSLAASASWKRKAQQPALDNSYSSLAYQRKLSAAFQSISGSAEGDEDLEMQVNPADPMEVGLACVLDGNLEALYGVLAGWSLTIATAVIEIADAGGWLGQLQGPNRDLFDGFDADDLMVLSYASREGPKTNKDEILADYARQLSRRGLFTDPRSGKMIQGWQLAIGVIGRMDNREEATQKVAAILEKLPLTSNAQVDEAVTVCHRVGLPGQAQKMAQRYADHLMETTHNYGEAVLHYVEGGNLVKMKEVLDLLISLSVVQSTAYPADADLDDSTRALLSAPKQLLMRVNRLDPEAAQSVLTRVSGYATLRTFYELRDQEEDGASSRALPPQGSLARKKAAAAALVACIMSAADGIHGGLYDDGVNSAIQVDVLLVLLGESIPFVNQAHAVLTEAQAFSVLKAVEDLSTVSSQIRSQCEECLKSTVKAFRGSNPPSPRSTLKKTLSASTMASSRFSMMGSEMLQSESGHQAKESSGEDSGYLVKRDVKRHWDWRGGMSTDAKGEDILKILRHGLAKEISRLWIGDGDEG